MATGYTSLDSFVTEIRQYAHGCPPIMIRTHVKNAIINFCERTFILKKEPSSFCLDEEDHTYTLKYSGDRYVTIALKSVQLGEDSNGRSIPETTEHNLDNTARGWKKHEGSTVRAIMLLDDVNKVRVYPIPTSDSDEDLYITAAVRPKRDQTEVDTFIYEKWEEVIQAGALRSLLSIPESSWYNAKLAQMAEEEYKRGVRRARKTTTVGTTEVPGQALPQNYTVMGSNDNLGGRIITWD